MKPLPSDTRDGERPPATKPPGRPFWKVPRRFVIGEHGAPGPWAALSSAEKSVLPVLEVWSDGVNTGVGFHNLSLCTGARSTVAKGLEQLSGRGLIRRDRRSGYQARRINTITTLSQELIAGNRESFGRFCRDVVMGGAWADLTPTARAIYVVLICGVQNERFRAWTSTPAAAPWATGGGLLPENGDERFLPDGTVNPDFTTGAFDWRTFARTMKSSPDLLRDLLPHLPYVSLSRGDEGEIGVGFLARLVGVTGSAVRDGIASLSESELVVVARRSMTETHRFIMPDVVRWMANPALIPPRSVEPHTPTNTTVGDPPF